MATHCPRDGTELTEVERSGVRIDACKTCRGVWLDRGELDKLIEHETQAFTESDHDDEAFLREVTGGRDAAPKPGLDKDTAKRIFDEYRDYKRGGHHGYKPKRKKSIFEQIFD